MEFEEKNQIHPEEKQDSSTGYFSKEALVWGWAGAMLMMFLLVFVNALFNTDTTQLIAVFGCYQACHSLALFKGQRKVFYLITGLAWLVISILNCYLYIVRITA